MMRVGAGAAGDADGEGGAGDGLGDAVGEGGVGYVAGVGAVFFLHCLSPRYPRGTGVTGASVPLVMLTVLPVMQWWMVLLAML